MGEPMQQPTSILITGASSGIGAALALLYARPGIRLALGGLEEALLAEVAAQCEARGAAVTSAVVDVRDEAAMAAWVVAEDDRAPLDLVIAAAGVIGQPGAPGDDPDASRRTYLINVLGVVNTVEPILPRLRARRRGQVCVLASLAGLVGIPRQPAYSGSKAAVAIMGDAWRGALAPYGVGVSVVCPGYVATPMVQSNRNPMPFLVSADFAAQRIADGLRANRGRIYFPWQNSVMAFLFQILPPSLRALLVPGTKHGTTPNA
jgi:short-subunit dehydrogenase